MPQADPAECVDAAVGACPALPFWPTRPLAVPAEQMIRQWALGLPGVGDGPAGEDGLAWVGRERAPGRAGLAAEAAGTLDRFLEVLGSRPAGWLKLQATGPVTLALELAADGRRAFEVPAARGPLALGYAARIRSVVTGVREALPAWKVLLVLDEPSLASPAVAERPQPAVELWRGLGATGADLTGLHCCATPPWGLVLDLEPQLISFDAIKDGDAATDDPAFRRLVESGAAVAWGLVPANGSPAGAALDPEELADRLLDLVEWTAGDYLPEVLARSVVTPTCGLASLSGEEAVRRLRAAAEIGPVAWDLAGLP
jgi:methionine synthase II (cobalamin-independent)